MELTGQYHVTISLIIRLQDQISWTSQINARLRLCEALPRETMELGLKHEVFEPLLDFVYAGSLASEKMEKHINTLFFEAHYYRILYLWEFCAHHILLTLTPSNALQVFKLAFGCRHGALLEAALNCIFENMEEMAFSSEYEDFALGFPCREMCMNITRAFCLYAKIRRVTGV